MRTLSMLCIVGVGALGLMACGGQPPAPTPAPTTLAPAAPASPADAAAAAPTGFGVQECDDYIKAYMDCIDTKVPAAMRDQVRQGFEQTKSQWQQAASTPQGKDGLKMACTQARDAAKTAMSAYGCAF
jgi:hypothetical protein